jgi:hypothetical protein
MTFSITHSLLFSNFNLLLNTQIIQGRGKTGKKTGKIKDFQL